MVHGKWDNLRAIIWWPLYGHVSFWKLLEFFFLGAYKYYGFLALHQVFTLYYTGGSFAEYRSIVQYNSVRWRDKIYTRYNIKCIDQVLHTSGLLRKTFSWQFKKESDRYLTFKHGGRASSIPFSSSSSSSCMPVEIVWSIYIMFMCSCKKCIPRDFEFICQVLKSLRWPTRRALIITPGW